MIAKLETEGGCKILRVSGRIDFESALDFEQQLNSMIQQEGDCFIIELSGVELLSSAGLRVLLSTAKRVSHRDASLGLAAPSQVVRQVFEISHFNLLFKIFPSVAEAVAGLKGPRQATEAVPLPEAPAEPDVPAEKISPKASEPPPVLTSPAVEDPSRRSELPPSAVPAIAPSSSGPAMPHPKPGQEGITGTSKPPTPQPAAAEKAPSAGTVPPGNGSRRSISRPPAVQSPPLPTPQTAPSGATVLPVPESPVLPKTPVPPPLPPAAEPRAPTVKPPQIPRTDTVPAARQSAQPPPLAAAETAVPIARPPEPSPVRKSSVPPSRLEAFFPARLEVRAEGNSYACRDGDVIGSAGQVGKAYFSQIPGLAPRHLLIGRLEGRWFVFTPQNVQHPFSFDGHSLIAGERMFLQYAEHQLEFNGRVFGLRLVPVPKKKGFFSRIFGKK